MDDMSKHTLLVAVHKHLHSDITRLLSDIQTYELAYHWYPAANSTQYQPEQK